MPISYILSILSLILFSSSQEVQYNCQLHRISFCADDKTDKRIFTFICKDSESNKHLCYVFDSEKCVRHDLKKLFVIFTYCFGTFTSNLNGYLNVAQKTNGQTKHCWWCYYENDLSCICRFQAEEITLTIGQAFDLAYKKFLESGGKDVETRKQIGGLQKRVSMIYNCS